jgi:hypothetical protein
MQFTSVKSWSITWKAKRIALDVVNADKPVRDNASRTCTGFLLVCAMRRYADWIDAPIVCWARFSVLWLAQLLLGLLLIFAWLLIAIIFCWAPMSLLRAALRTFEPRILSIDEIITEEEGLDAGSGSANPPQP